MKFRKQDSSSEHSQNSYNLDANQDIVNTVKRNIERSLKIKQAFVNCLLVLMNNFLSFESYSLNDKGKNQLDAWLVIDDGDYQSNFDSSLYLKNINEEYHPFYERLINTITFNQLLLDNHDQTWIKVKEFKR